MTDKNLTHILAILDRSGSMASIKNDTEGGFNAFIEEQKNVDGECYVTLVQFDNQYDTVYKNKALSYVPRLNLQPRGSTALHDAIGRAVVEKGEELARLPENKRPGTVTVVVLTDGYENASRDWTGERVRELVQRQQSVYNWVFVFMGSNQDAVLTGSSLGFRSDYSLTYSDQNVGAAFAATASNVANYRSSIASGLSHGEAVLNSTFTDKQRDEAN